MRHEMKCRVSELSASLITEFQYRGDADHSKEVKKAFVSAFITAEEKVEYSSIPFYFQTFLGFLTFSQPNRISLDDKLTVF